MNDQQIPPQPRRSAIVTSASGESDHDDDDSSIADADEPLFPPEQGADELYDPHGDEENEAFVYKHMRCGLPETVQVRKAAQSNTDSEINTNSNTKRDLQALKPRHSDAVLSCPCCFEIVCMDCQQHERHANQFRAMFVMNVAVHWDHVLVYDKAVQGLVRVTEQTAPAAASASAAAAGGGASAVDSDTNASIQIPPESGSSDSTSNNNGNGNDNETVTDRSEHYYQTVCANCQTQVAALDMTDEVYHFYGCLASF
jgi:hypothetical protein